MTAEEATSPQVPDMDLDLSLDTAPEASALQVVADTMAAEAGLSSSPEPPAGSSPAVTSSEPQNGASHNLNNTSESGVSETSQNQTEPQSKAQTHTQTQAQPQPQPQAQSKDQSQQDGDNSSADNKKRPSDTSSADLNAPPAKVTKRRAARACVSCRARKVRCDVVEGAPCGNCRWDNVECVVQESRRRKKTLLTASTATPGSEAQLRAKPGGVNIQSNAELRPGQPQQSAGAALVNGSSSAAATAVPANPANGGSHSHSQAHSHTHNQHAASNLHGNAPVVSDGGMHKARAMSGVSDASSTDGHVPHMIYQQSAYRQENNLVGKLQAAASADPNTRRMLVNLLTQVQAVSNPAPSFGDLRTSQFLASLEEPDLQAQLPAFVKPLPSRIASEDVRYLHAKQALSLPPLPLQNALLQAYVEYVHPYMPLLDLSEFLGIVNSREGLCGQVSLFLYQAVMFAATAFVDMKSLRDAGYNTRKAARRVFFSKTRLLYDFDYESDRLVLVQALLLMTYWYETPDDQKDTWHWMGVAISLAHTIGLHRNPATTAMPIRKQNLWKRIWWSCFMRDRLVALGMRRPTRIKDEDYDVPMLCESDFDLEVLPEDNTIIPPECTLLRDVSMQEELATLCVAKAKLCLCISQMLKTQYSVLIRDKVRPNDTVNSTMMLFPNKKLENFDSVTSVDLELMAWAEALPASCEYRPLTPLDVKNGRSTIAVQRHLLHMVYYTTISALHRPQFLPSSPSQAPTASRQVQEMSRLRVRDAASHITRMASELHHLRLEKYLPTTGVTVMLPAMIIHLLEMKNPGSHARERATRGFRQCMRVMEKLREIYAAADYATGFLDAALSKASIDMNTNNPSAAITQQNLRHADPKFAAQTPPPDNAPYMTPSEAMFNSKSDPSMTQLSRGDHNGNSNDSKSHLPQTINAAALDLSVTGAASPPPTDRDLESAFEEVFTPSASGSSSGGAEPLDLQEFLQGQADIDWNAVAGTDFDVDQWLQFPPEGVNNQDEGLMAGVFSDEGMQDAMKWAAGGMNDVHQHQTQHHQGLVDHGINNMTSDCQQQLTEMPMSA